MSCVRCSDDSHLICSKCFDDMTKCKKQQLVKIKQQIQSVQEMRNLLIQEKSKSQTFKKLVSQTQSNLSQQKRMAILRKKIADKKHSIALIQQRRVKQQKNKDIQECNNIEIQSRKIESQAKLEELRTVINQKTKQLRQKYHCLNYKANELSEDFSIIISSLYSNFPKLQKKALFQIGRSEELDTGFNNLDSLQQSYYCQVQKLQQIHIKNKTNSRGLHIMLQNIIVLVLTCKIWDIWIPYPIEISDCRDWDRISNGFKAKVEDLTIFNQHLIDFGNSMHLTSNIIQYFPSKIKGQSQNSSANVYCQQFVQEMEINFQLQTLQKQVQFQSFVPNQDAPFNERRIQLTKNFINCIQANLQYLCSKHQIQQRPLVFLNKIIIQKIIKGCISRLIGPYLSEQTQTSMYQKKSQKEDLALNSTQAYHSMLKQLKVYQLVDIINQYYSIKSESALPLLQQQPIFNKVISEKPGQEEDEYDDTGSSSEKIELKGKYNRKSSSQNIDTIPQTIITINSTDTDNDDFQVLK